MRAEESYGILEQGFGLKANNSLKVEDVLQRAIDLSWCVTKSKRAVELSLVAQAIIDINASFYAILSSSYTVSLPGNFYKKITCYINNVIRYLCQLLRSRQLDINRAEIELFVRYFEEMSKCDEPDCLSGVINVFRRRQIGYIYKDAIQVVKKAYIDLRQESALYETYLHKLRRYNSDEKALAHLLEEIRKCVWFALHYLKSLKLNQEKLIEVLDKIHNIQATKKSVKACLLQSLPESACELKKINAQAFVLDRVVRAKIAEQPRVKFSRFDGKLVDEPTGELLESTKSNLSQLLKQYDEISASQIRARYVTASKLSFCQKWSALSSKKKWLFAALILTELAAIAALTLFVPGLAIVTAPYVGLLTLNMIAAAGAGITFAIADCVIIANSNSKPKAPTSDLYKESKQGAVTAASAGSVKLFAYS